MMDDRRHALVETIWDYHHLDHQLAHANSILVQKPHLERLSDATFRKVWPEQQVRVTCPRVSLDSYLGDCSHDTPSPDDVIGIMVADLQRIRLYSGKGFQVHQDVPDDVWARVRGTCQGRIR